MPFFNFECTKCEEKFEDLVMSNSEEKTKCPKCGSVEVHKLPGYMGLYSMTKMNTGVPSKKHKRYHD